ncbi:transferrin-binding protein-like solute binding protein [Pseudooceanicola sp. LIPI14-2-Ac024]|uniref:transferrin-binding protein-like solute binding protein n=1 Tax=Pseudooceanicola sp. LIPI14-2-Ac024 TaxID=3344875 RepID=UPI0035CF2FE1
MWKEAAIPLALAMLLSGCSGDGSNPFGSGGGGDGDDGASGGITVPESVAGNVTSMSYDADAETLTVTGVSLDEVPFEAVYTRQAALDSQFAGYEVYTAQDDPLDRHSTALVLQSAGNRFDGQVRAGIAVTGGPRNRYFGGGFFERDGDYDPPSVSETSGMVSYVGTYVGLTNVSASRDLGMLLTPDPSTPSELIPSRAAEVTGNVFINADFADNTVEGNVYDRVLDGSTSLPSLVLIATDIDANGTFAGDVEYQGDVGNDIGDYAGLFGGTDAQSLGGVLKLDEFDNDLGILDDEEEYGVFVLEQCGTAGASSSLCDDVK